MGIRVPILLAAGAPDGLGHLALSAAADAGDQVIAAEACLAGGIPNDSGANDYVTASTGSDASSPFGLFGPRAEKYIAQAWVLTALPSGSGWVHVQPDRCGLLIGTRGLYTAPGTPFLVLPFAVTDGEYTTYPDPRHYTVPAASPGGSVAAQAGDLWIGVVSALFQPGAGPSDWSVTTPGWTPLAQTSHVQGDGWRREVYLCYQLPGAAVYPAFAGQISTSDDADWVGAIIGYHAAPERAGVSLIHSSRGELIVASETAAGDGVTVQRAPFATPAFDFSVTIAGLAQPDLLQTGDDSLLLVGVDGAGAVVLRTCEDDAETWSDPQTMFSTGANPRVKGVGGYQLVAAYVDAGGSGTISGSLREPGYADWSAEFTFLSSDGATPLRIEGRGFDLYPAPDEEEVWVLWAAPEGETDFTTFRSVDEGRTWARGT